MNKIKIVSFMIAIFLLLTPSVFAESNTLGIKILSPDGVKGLPGYDQIIKAEITNNTNHIIDDVMVYITMADLNRHMTVNLEDYGADKPVVVGTLNAGENKVVELPIRFVYVSKFYLYTTIVSGSSKEIISSNAIPVEILGNTMIDKGMVQIISIITPIIVLILILFIRLIYKKRKYN